MPNMLRRSSRVNCRISTPSTVIDTAFNIVEAHQELDDGRLAGAGRPDDGHFLPRFDLRREIIDDYFVRVITEAHMLER